MVQTTYPSSDHKNDLAQLRHSPPHHHPAARRPKGSQSHSGADAKPPSHSRGNGMGHHWFSLHLDEKGTTKVECASSITDNEKRKILQAAHGEYRKVLTRIKANGSSSHAAATAEAAARTSRPNMRHASKAEGPVSASDYKDPGTRSVHQSRKRRRSSSTEESSSCSMDGPDRNGTEQSKLMGLTGIEIQDTKKLKEYLFDAFTSFQQINCRTLCKSWIRRIEPKKQVNHPYNGNVKVKGGQKSPSNDFSSQKDADPEETKPKWWPPKEECPHKEPDHIKKERELSEAACDSSLTLAERLALLCHILMNTRRLHDCTTEDLRKAIKSDRAKIKPQEKESILEDVWKIGNELERFREGAIDPGSMVLVRERKEEARMIRGGGRSRKAVDAKEEGEEEDSSECADAEPEVDQTLTPTTPSGLQSSVQYLQAGQVPGVRRLHHDGRYRKSPSTQHFQPPENKDNYHNPQADYAMPVEISPVLEDISNHASSGHVFNEGAFAENSYGTIQDIHSHPDMFPPDEQQMIGHWAISATPELYPMHYNGEPSQTPALHPPNGEHIFGAYAYDGSRKHPYRNSIHGYSTNTHGQFQIGYEDDLARFQRINSCSFPVNSSNKFHPASTTQQPSYELPSHVRD